MSRITSRAVSISALCAVLAFGAESKAAFMAYIADDALVTGGGDTIVTDQGAGDNFPGSALVGQINTGALSINGFTIVTDVAQSKPLIGSAAAPELDLTFSAVTNDNLTHTVYLYISDTGFTLANGLATLTLGGTEPGSLVNSVVGVAYGGNSNSNLNMTNLIAQVGPTTASPFALTAISPLVSGTSPYGLTIGLAITRNTPGTTSGSLHFAAVAPEPASAMVVVSLLGTTLGRRRRARA